MTNEFFEIRTIHAEDKIPLQVGLKMLSPESIRQRFFTNKKEFSDKELQYLTEVDQENHLAFVAVHHQDGKALPAGVIRAIRKKEDPHMAEMGIIIVDCYQGKGLGMKLMNAIAKRCTEVGITTLYGDYHTSNVKMIKLLEKFAKNHRSFTHRHTGDGFIYFEALL